MLLSTIFSDLSLNLRLQNTLQQSTVLTVTLAGSIYSLQLGSVRRQRRQQQVQRGGARQAGNRKRKAHVSSATTHTSTTQTAIYSTLYHKCTNLITAHRYVLLLPGSHVYLANSPIIMHCIRSHTISRPG